MTDKLEAVGNRKGACLLALMSMAVIRLWLMPLGSSLSLDETGTYWIVHQGLWEIPSRTVTPPQSLLYLIIAGVAAALGGASEIALRLPSTLALAAAAFLLYRLGRRLLDRDAALLGTLVFVCWPGIAFAAADARPYALGVLAAIGAMLLLVRWLEGGAVADGLGYAAAASLTVYLHYLFASTYVVHATYAICRLRDHAPVRARSLCAIATVNGVLLLPLAGDFLSLVQSGARYSYGGRPGFLQLLGALLPQALAGGALIGLLLGFLVGPACIFCQPLRRRAPLVLLLSWATVPVLLLFAVSRLTPYQVFAPRYLLCAVPGLALLAGWALRAIGPAHKQVLVVVAVTLSSLVSLAPLRFLWFVHGKQDWRGAMESVRLIAASTETPVLVLSGFAVDAKLDSPADSMETSRLLAPLSIYPAGGKPLPAPYGFEWKHRKYLERIGSETLEPAKQFLYVGPHEGGALLGWLHGRFAERFEIEQVGAFEGVSVVLFQRRADRGK